MEVIKTITVLLISLMLFSCDVNDKSMIPITSLSNNKPALNTKKCEPQGSVLKAVRLRVIDGDTIEAIPYDGKSERIRLVGIDAPEYNQPFGEASTQALIECVTGSTVKILWEGQDRYQRLLGTVFADYKDCNLNQIEKGFAWHYKQYQSSQSEYDRVAYSNAEVTARLNQKGLWSAERVTAPWDFRKDENPNYRFNDTIYDLDQTSCTKDGILPVNHHTLY